MTRPSRRLPLRPYIPGWAAASFFAALSSAAVLFLPKIIQTVIDSLNLTNAPAFLIRNIVLLTVLCAAAVLFKFLAGWIFARTAKNLWEALSTKCMACSLEFSHAGLFTAVNQDARAVSQFAENGLARLASSFWLYALGFVFLAGLDWKYIPAASAATFISFSIAFFWHNRVEQCYARERAKYDEYIRFLSNSVNNLEWLKGRAREEEAGFKIAEHSFGHLNAALRASLISAGLTPVILTVWAAAGFAFIFIGMSGYKNGTLTCGEFAASFQYLAFFSLPALDFSYAGDLFRRARVGWRNIRLITGAPDSETPGHESDFDRQFAGDGLYVFKHDALNRKEMRRICDERDGVFLERTTHFFRRPLIENFLLITPYPSLEEVLEAMSRAGLADPETENPGFWLDRDPNTFSSGERKRAALARLFLMRDKNIWILEDPFAGLNHEKAVYVLGNLKEFSKIRVLIIFTDDFRAHQMAENYEKSDLEA